MLSLSKNKISINIGGQKTKDINFKIVNELMSNFHFKLLHLSKET